MADPLDWYKSALGGDVGTGIPLNLDRTPVPDTGQGTAWSHLQQAPGDILTSVLGLLERGQLGGLNALGLRSPGSDIYRAQIPVEPGLRAAEGAATFATGGLANSLFPAAGTLRAGAQYAAPAARETIPGLLADESGALRLAPAQAPAAPKFPQYAESYPPVAPGVPTIDPKKGTEYLAKAWSPEATAFAKERDAIVKDMRTTGYEPYYDPAQRFHVDPINYPPNVDTSAIAPAKQATIDKYMASVGSEEARERLRAAYQRGTEMPDTADWYALGQVEQDFIKELGPEAGRKAFQDRLATSMAATTGGADPQANWLMSTYGNYLRNHELPYPQAAHEMPYPVGSRRPIPNMRMHEKVFDEGGFSYLGATNPKRHNFSQNFTGNRGVATIDEQMTEAMTPGLQMPPSNTYGLYEGVLGEEAAAAGVFPQNYQDVAWAGAKNLRDPKYTAGQPFIQTINESIERTHRLTGMPRDEIVRRGIVKGEIPMYGLLGATGLGAAANQYER